MEKLFYCYSTHLKKYLLDNGVKYLHSGTHYKTRKNFYVFVGDEFLNSLLEEWKIRKQ